MGNLNNWFLANPNDGAGWNIVQYDHNNMLENAGLGLCDETCKTRQFSWSINRPTCQSLNRNPIVGPLLSNPTLHAQYLGYVKDMLDNVLTDALFTEVSDHIKAMKEYMLADPFASGLDVNREALITLDNYDCAGTASCPFLAALNKRREVIYEQLKALEDGAFPRPTEDLFDEGEKCVDWNSAEKTKGSSDECDSSCALAEACYNSKGCMFRDTEDGSWTGAMAACNPANGYCDKCFPDTPCPTKKGGKGSKGSNGANHNRLRARKLFGGVEQVISKGRCDIWSCLRQNKEWLNWFFSAEIENPDRNKCPKYGGWVEWAKSKW